MNYGKIDKNKFMTLENTVDLLVDAVNQHYDVDRVLANFGIKVLGTKSSPSELPRPAGAFGDAYLVSTAEDGQGEPYDVYIWTRLTSNETDPNYGDWLNIGLISTMGPPGPQGEPGIQGPPGESTRWYISNNVPVGNYNQGDMLLLPTGDVYIYGEGGWGNPAVNIKGRPGQDGVNGFTPYIENGYWYVNGQSTNVRAEGRDGATGTPGTAIIIVGKRDDGVLPEPDSVPRNYGYLVNVDGVERLYFIAGIEGEENWQYIDYSGNGTIVTTDGTAQATWESNTKLDKPTTIDGSYAVVGTSNGGSNWRAIRYTSSQGNNTIMFRGSDGRAEVSYPQTNPQIANKIYVDDVAANKVDKTTLPTRIYSTNSEGVSSTTPFTSAPTEFTVMYRYTDGRVQVGTPVLNVDATNKQYVDAANATKLDKVSIETSVYGTDEEGNQTTYEVHVDESWGNDTIPLRSAYGNIIVPEITGQGVSDLYLSRCATSKKYVDDRIKIATFLSDEKSALNITPSDLPGITNNTSIEVTASFSSVSTLPSIVMAIDNKDISTGEYANINKVTAYNNYASFKLIYANNQFIAPKDNAADGNSDVTGTTLSIGRYDTSSGQTRLTIVYR